MMKPAKAWSCDDSPTRANLLRRPRDRAILCEAVMSPIVMVVIDILIHNPVKMITVKGDDVIKDVLWRVLRSFVVCEVTFQPVVKTVYRQRRL